MRIPHILWAVWGVAFLAGFGPAMAEVSAGASGVHLLQPGISAVLDVPATTITLQSPTGKVVELEVNGTPVASNLIGRTEEDAGNQTVSRTWYGVGLHAGKNDISAWLQTPQGRVLGDHIEVQVRGQAQRLVLSCRHTKIPADGESEAQINGELDDNHGNATNTEVPVTVEASAGSFEELDACPDIPGYQVKTQRGKFVLHLRAASTAQAVTVKASCGEMQASQTIEFIPDRAHSLVTGVIDLRVGPGAAGGLGNGRDVFPSQNAGRSGVSAQGSGYVKGAIGEFVLIGAYNSSRPLSRDANGRDGVASDTQGMDQQYPTLGDDSTREQTADSKSNLYVRIETQQGFILFGNYGTPEMAASSQQFSAVNRQFHAFKGNIEKGRVGVTAFYADDVRGFQRDTISPDGTGGYYYLSSRPLIVGSERVYLETQELSHPGLVINRVEQRSSVDYDIDYDQGTLLFHQPVLRTDAGPNGEVLVRQIVVTYEYDQPGTSAHAFGGRLRYRLSGSGSAGNWFGATLFEQAQGLRNFTLFGADSHLELGHGGSLVTEYAHSRNMSELFSPISGSAYRFDLQQPLGHGVQFRSYGQSAETGFANDATVSFVAGQTRYGAGLTAPLTASTTFRMQVDREVNRGVIPSADTGLIQTASMGDAALPSAAQSVNNSLTTITAGLEHQQGKTAASIDLISTQRTDANQPQTLNGSSTQIRTRYSSKVSRHLDVVVESRNSLTSHSDPVETDHTLVGAHMDIAHGIGIGVAEQLLTRGQFAGKSITSAEIDGKTNIGDHSAVKTRLSLQSDAGGPNAQAAMGVEHQWNVTPGLTAKAFYERVSGNLLGKTAAGPQTALAEVTGPGASTLGTGSGSSEGVSADYHGSSGFIASGRYEVHTSDYGRNTLLSASAQGKIARPWTALFDYQMAGASNHDHLGPSVALRLGLAYRDPQSDLWNVLLRYDYRVLPSTVPLSILQGTGNSSKGQTLGVEGIYAPSWRWEIYGKYAVRRSEVQLAQDESLAGFISLTQLRATCRFAYNMDVTAEGRWISQPALGESSSSLAADIGYYLTPNLRLALGYSFGRSHDLDFSGQRFAGGLYFGLTVRLDQLWGGFGVQRSEAAK